VTADPDAIARSVLACPAVDSLDGERPGSPTTYLPGRRIAGLSVADATIAVQVRMRWGATADTLNQQVRAAVAPFAGGRRIEITISDIAVPGQVDESAGIPTPSA
jgi:hypothetical protein